jgi:dCTP deaminase
MVLNDVSIKKYCEAGMVEPYEPKMVNPASLDLRFSGRYRLPRTEWGNMGEMEMLSLAMELDRYPEMWEKIKHELWGETFEVEHLVLVPGQVVLADTLEVVNIPVNLRGVLWLKSSRGRELLEHMHAGYVDPGFYGSLTLEMVNAAPWPMLLKKGQPILQLELAECHIPEKSYRATGRYNEQGEPQPSK